jgi:GDP-L-fucose synthase
MLADAARGEVHHLAERLSRRASATLLLLRHYSDASTINVGVGRDVTIAELASLVADGVQGPDRIPTSRSDGTPRKLLDVSRLTALGWQARTAPADGIATNYRWVDNELAQGRRPRGFPAEATRAAAHT